MQYLRIVTLLALLSERGQIIDSPFIDDKFAFAGVPGLEELLGCVYVGEYRDKGNYEAHNPDTHDQRENNLTTKIFLVGRRESYDLTPPEKDEILWGNIAEIFFPPVH